MHLKNHKRQDITALPSADGVNGSLTAGDPHATQLVVGSGSGSGVKNTGGPDFAPGFVSMHLVPVPLFSQLPSTLETVSSLLRL